MSRPLTRLTRRRVTLGPHDWPAIYAALCLGMEAGWVPAIAYRRVIRRIGYEGMAAARRGVAPRRRG